MAKPRMESRRAAKRELAVLAKDFELVHIPGVKELIETETDYHKAHDHWKPINQGGTNEFDNLRATHKSCNRLKNDFIAEEFFSSMTTILAYQSRQNEEIARTVIHTGIKLVISMTARKIRSFVF